MQNWPALREAICVRLCVQFGDGASEPHQLGLRALAMVDACVTVWVEIGVGGWGLGVRGDATGGRSVRSRLLYYP